MSFTNTTSKNEDIDYSIKTIYSIQTKSNQFQNILGGKMVRYDEYQDDENYQDNNEIPRKYMEKILYHIFFYYNLFYIR